VVGVALAVSLFTLVSMTKIWVAAFWGEVAPDPAAGGILHNHRLMATGTSAMVAISLVIAFGAGPLYDFALRAAAQLVDVSTYVTAVRSS